MKVLVGFRCTYSRFVESNLNHVSFVILLNTNSEVLTMLQTMPPSIRHCFILI